MATLTAAQRADMQGDLGISFDGSVFSNTELDRLYTRASSDYNLAVFYGYRQLLAQANKFFNYTAGMTRIQRNQMRDNIRDAMDFWKDEARVSGNQVRMLGLLEIPPRDKDEPSG
jgi:hypothetical protein